MFKLERPVWEIKKFAKTTEARNTIASAVAANPLKYFCPTGKQEEFIRAVANSTVDTKIPIILLTAANGIGKTTIAIQTVINFILGPQNSWYEFEIFKNFPFPKLVWYISTPTALSETVEPEFRRLLQNVNSVVYDKGGKRTLDKIALNGWIIKFKTFNQAESEFESANVGIINIDEPSPEPIWHAVKSRRRKGCITMLPLTPLYCPPYLQDEIKAAADAGRKGYYHLIADVYSACKNRGVRGHLDPKIINDMLAGYSQEERAARAMGEFAFFFGKIYPMLDSSIHFVQPYDYPILPGSIIKQVIDPHDGRPIACGYMAKMPNGRIVWFAETPDDKGKNYWDMKQNIPLPSEIESWIRIEDRFDVVINQCSMTRVMDRHFGWQTRGRANYAELLLDESKKQGCEFNYNESYKTSDLKTEIIYGHERVRQALAPLSDGKPGMVVWNTCFHIWNGISHYIRKNETNKSSEDKPGGTGKIIEKYKDFADIVRYGVCDEQNPFGYKEVQTEETDIEKYLQEIEREYHQKNKSSKIRGI